MKILGHTWLSALNYFFLQWSCYRLAKEVNEAGKIIGWRFIGPVVPLSGWGDNNPYKWIKNVK